MHKVLVTGSREFTATSYIQGALRAEWEACNHDTMMVIQGGAKGADSIAGDLAKKSPSVYSVTVDALWDHLGKRAGPARNRAMLALGPDVVLAFYKEGAANIGTSDMVRAAREAGVPVKEFRA